MRKRGFYSIIILVIYIWAGMLLGISFIEAPLKFQAPNVTLALGLGIGRLVFGALNKIEILFAVSLIILGAFTKLHQSFWIMFILIGIILFLQTLWLLPALDKRAIEIMNGKSPSGSSPHIFYIIGEVVKLLLLVALGLRTYNESIKKAIL